MMKLTGKKRIFIYINSLLAVAILSAIAYTIEYHTIFNWLALGVCISLFILSLKKIKKDYKSGTYEVPKNGYKDIIKKRINNLIYIAIYVVAGLFVDLYSAIISSPRKRKEIFTALGTSYGVLLLIIFLLYATAVIFNVICDKEEFRKCEKYFLRQGLISSVYWILYLCICVLFGEEILVGLFSLASCIYFISAIICNMTVRKKIMEVNLIWKKLYTVLIVLAIVIIASIVYMQRDTYYLQGYINQLPRLRQNTVIIKYREKDGVYEIHMEKDEFRILQITDIHLGGSIVSMEKDRKALIAVYKEIEATKPDLVIVTGDMSFPLGIMSMSLNNGDSVSQFAAFMRNLNIPWAFTFGNHDTENFATYSKEGLCDLYKRLSFKTSGTLLFPYKQPNITGRNNQVIELYNKDGSINQALFLMDSNSYTSDSINDYDYIHDDQVKWYEDEIKRLNKKAEETVSSMLFFHIPLQQYREAYELYTKGSDEVKYYFGSNDEQMINKVCCSEHPSKIFDKIVELGSTKALFCGHDHYNNMSLEYKGIRLTYGMSIDYLAMPGIDKSQKQRGGTLITIHKDSSYDIKQIPLTSIYKKQKFNINNIFKIKQK